MSAPHVAGVAALIKSARPDLSMLQVKDVILSTVDVYQSLIGKCLTGGRLNAKKALDRAALLPPPALLPPDTAQVAGRMVAGDFNGDGRADVAYMVQSSAGIEIHALRSTGSSYVPELWLSYPYPYVASSVTDRMVAGDFNGDGKADIATMYDYGNATIALHVFLSTGNNFTPFQTWFQQGPGAYIANMVTGRMVAGDFNGDGKADIATMYDYGNATIALHVFFFFFSSFNMGQTWYHQKP
jgi:hypothetical protein